MIRKLLVLAVPLLFCSLIISAQEISKLPGKLPNSWLKAENGLVINWVRGISDGPSTSIINVYANQGSLLASIDVLPIVKEAKDVSIYDVSAIPGKIIAVSAVYGKEDAANTIAATLLVFDFAGKLLSATALDPARTVLLLEIDENSHIWGLMTGAGENDPTTSPVVTEYDATGATLRTVLNWNSFPAHADHIQQDPEHGPAAAGYSQGEFWFWLPGYTDLVAIRTADGTVVTKTQTGLPRLAIAATKIWPLQLVRQSNGTLVADFGTDSKRLLVFSWAPNTKEWGSKPIDHACAGARLIGSDQNDFVFLRLTDSNPLCKARI